VLAELSSTRIVYKAFMPLDDPTIAALDRTREVEIRTPRRDGSLSSRPIWIVVVDGEAYVRSWLAGRGAWYRRALADRRATIAVDGRELDVGLEPAEDEELNQRVSDAFRAKYGERAPGPTEEMVTPEVSRTTLRLSS
jgi:hypothetical protein